MEPLPLALVLAAALLHASWNLAVKTSSDRFLASAAQVVFGSLTAIPLLVILGVPTEAWRSIAASGLIHLVYGLSLAAGYEKGDLSLVYPVARGVAPIIVTIAAALLLDDLPSTGALVAIGIAVLGVLFMARSRSPAGLGWGLVTGFTIAAYTTVDGAAVRTLDSAVAYTAAVTVTTSMLFAVVVLIRRPISAIRATVASEWRLHTLAGSASVGAYMLVLAAARLAPLGVVAAFRETSILFGVLGAWLLLGEREAVRRLPGAALIAVGLVVLVTVG